jgi:hypothetical protein
MHGQRLRINVLATATFLLIACTGSAVAAVPKNAVGTKQLKNGAVTTKKLKKQAVTAQKVKKNTLTGTQIKESSLGIVPNADTLDGLHATAFALAGSPPSGQAGGVLSGTFPNPTLSLSGGPCPNGQALVQITGTGQLICATGVYSDDFENIAVTPEPFPALEPFMSESEEEEPAEGVENSAFGSGALRELKTGFGNSAFGRGALELTTTGSTNSAFGDLALTSNTTGGENTAVGWEAMNSNTAGRENSALGWAALEQNTTGERNSAVGAGALGANTVGEENSALGSGALSDNTAGNKNTAAGWGAMSKNTTGEENSVFGHAALFNNTTGQRNVAVGQAALAANTSGETNTALGHLALSENTTGKNNVAVGSSAGGGEEGPTAGEWNIYVGANVTGGAAETETIRIGKQGTQKRAFLAGVKATPIAGSPVVVSNEGQLGEEVSSRRFKRDIRPLNSQADGLMALRPVSFRYRQSVVRGPDLLHFGLIAEQVAKVYPNLVVRGSDGRPRAVAYQELPALLVAQAQRQQTRINRQHGKIRALQAGNSRLQAQNRRQQAQIDWLIRRARGGR